MSFKNLDGDEGSTEHQIGVDVQVDTRSNDLSLEPGADDRDTWEVEVDSCLNLLDLNNIVTFGSSQDHQEIDDSVSQDTPWKSNQSRSQVTSTVTGTISQQQFIIRSGY